METFQILLAGLTAVILFVFGLEHFSKEIQRIAGERFRRALSRATSVPVAGVVLGAVVTAVIQSSSATSVIAISLVNAGILSFRNSVGIIFGSNVGTTITAQLVAFKLTAFAPLFVIVGFLMSLTNSRLSIFGKAIFYFGFVFFSLNLISSSLSPLQGNGTLLSYLTQEQHPLLAILFGCLFTAVVQSSSVTTGLAIVFVQQGILGLETAVPLIMGANIGTTATALIAVFSMDTAAKKTALTHFLFNAGGVLIFIPPLLLWGDRLSAVETDPAIALAFIHLLFNVATSLIFISLINPFIRLIDWFLGEGKLDFERLQLPTARAEEDFDAIKEELTTTIDSLFRFLQQNYNQVTLAIETNFRGVFEAAERRLEYINFVKRDMMGYFARIATTVNDEANSREFLRLVTQFDYLFQIHDSISDLFESKRAMNENYIELNADILSIIREMSGDTLGFFDDVAQALAEGGERDLRKESAALQTSYDEANRDLLRLMSDPDRRDAGALSNFVTYSQRLKDKLINFYHIRHEALATPETA